MNPAEPSPPSGDGFGFTVGSSLAGALGRTGRISTPHGVIDTPAFIAVGVLAIIAITFGTIYTTRYKIKHGYPLTGGWGQAVYPKTTREDAERIKLLGQENAQLRTERG